MQAQDHTLDEREMLGEKRVEDCDENHDGDGEQSSVPSFVDVAVIVEDDETLDLGCRQKASDCNTALPSKRAKPANDE